MAICVVTRDDFDITVETNAEWVRVGTRGEIDLLTANLLEAQIAEASRSGRDVHLDLSGVTFMDSSGVHVLTAAMLDAALHDRRLTFADGLADPVERLLAVTGMLGTVRARVATGL